MITRYLPPNVGVRAEYSEEAVWRDALGRAEPLLVFASREPHLDAPEILPAGGMRATKYGPRCSPAWRPLV
jgi:hypothetical protein